MTDPATPQAGEPEQSLILAAVALHDLYCPDPHCSGLGAYFDRALAVVAAARVIHAAMCTCGDFEAHVAKPVQGDWAIRVAVRALAAAHAAEPEPVAGRGAADSGDQT